MKKYFFYSKCGRYEVFISNCVKEVLPQLKCKPSMIVVTTVKPVLSGHSKIDKTKVLKTRGSLMPVESIAECSPWSILQYF